MTPDPLRDPSDPLPEMAPAGDGATTAARFTDKWRARWPEWRIGKVFVPPTHRDIAAAWFALLQEFTDAAWSGADATPGLAKLAWWNEELIGWAKGARRHPLAPLLQRLPADWRALAGSLRGLQQTRGDAPTADPGSAGLDGVATAVAAVEAQLFAAAPLMPANEAPSSAIAAATTRGIVIDLLAERALLHGDAEIAMRLIDQRSSLAPSGLRPRRLQSAYVRHRLQQVARGADIVPASPWGSLLVSWRAARGA